MHGRYKGHFGTTTMNDITRTSKDQLLSELNDILHSLHLQLDVNNDVPESVKTSCGRFYIGGWLRGIRDRLHKFEESFRTCNETEPELIELRTFAQAVMDPENQPSQFGTVLMSGIVLAPDGSLPSLEPPPGSTRPAHEPPAVPGCIHDSAPTTLCKVCYPSQPPVPALQRIIEAYDAYRGRGVMPAPNQYADLVAAIEAARPTLTKEESP